jgi:hypothetical protein
MYVSQRDSGDTSLDHLRDLLREVAKSIERLELIVFLPIVTRHQIMLGSDEDENFRIEVDHYLKQLYRDDIYGLFSGQQPEVVELWGSRKSRVARLESLLKAI